MSLPSEWPQVRAFLGSPLAVEPCQAQLSADAGLPPVEMMACGGAVLASSAGVVAETLRVYRQLCGEDQQLNKAA